MELPTRTRPVPDWRHRAAGTGAAMVASMGAVAAVSGPVVLREGELADLLVLLAIAAVVVTVTMVLIGMVGAAAIDWIISSRHAEVGLIAQVVLGALLGANAVVIVGQLFGEGWGAAGLFALFGAAAALVAAWTARTVSDADWLRWALAGPAVIAVALLAAMLGADGA